MAIVDWPSNVGGQIMPKPAGATNALGQERLVEYYDPVAGSYTGETRVERYLYNNTGAAITPGNIYMLTFSGVTAQNPQVIVPATTTPTRNIVVAVESIATGGYGWFAVAGPVNATLNGDAVDIVIAHFLKVTAGTSTVAFIEDGAAETVNSHAIYVTPASGLGVTGAGNVAPTAAIPNKVILLGHRAVVA